MATGNLSQQYAMDPIPVPKMDPAPVQSEDPRTQQQGAQMPPVYYGGKTGSIAYVADNLLRGWLAGTKMGRERKEKQMADEVGAAKTGLDYIGQAYRAAVEGGDQKKIDETSKALSEAYSDYLNKAEKYALPEDAMGKDGKPKKKGVGTKLKEGFMGGEQPHLQIAHSTLEVLRKADPKAMYGPSKAEKQQSELTDLQLKSAKSQVAQQETDAANKDKWEQIALLPDDKLSPEQKKFKEFYEYEKFGKTPAEQKKDVLLQDALDGKIPPSGPKHDMAVQLGIVRPDVASTQFRQRMGKDGKPVTDLISIGPDGKVFSTQTLPGVDFIPPNQAQLAGQMINAQVSAIRKIAKNAHPEWNEQQLSQFALQSVMPNSMAGDWFQKNQEMDVLNRGIQSVMTKHRSKHIDKATGHEVEDYTPEAQSLIGSLIATTDDGRYTYLSKLGVDPKSTTSGHLWWKKPGPNMVGEYTEDQVAGYERQFLAELRAELHKQNPKLSDSQIDSMMPQPVMKQRAMAATPGQAGQSMQPPPGGGQQMQPPPGGQKAGNYKITVNGQTVTRQISDPAYIDALKAKGVKVELVQ